MLFKKIIKKNLNIALNNIDYINIIKYTMQREIYHTLTIFRKDSDQVGLHNYTDNEAQLFIKNNNNLIMACVMNMYNDYKNDNELQTIIGAYNDWFTEYMDDILDLCFEPKI
jgi:hypothetical protein